VAQVAAWEVALAGGARGGQVAAREVALALAEMVAATEVGVARAAARARAARAVAVAVPEGSVAAALPEVVEVRAARAVKVARAAMLVAAPAMAATRAETAAVKAADAHGPHNHDSLIQRRRTRQIPRLRRRRRKIHQQCSLAYLGRCFRNILATKAGGAAEATADQAAEAAAAGEEEALAVPQEVKGVAQKVKGVAGKAVGLAWVVVGVPMAAAAAAGMGQSSQDSIRSSNRSSRRPFKSDCSLPS